VVEVWECIPPTEVCFPPTADLDTPTDFLVPTPADKAGFKAAFLAQTTVFGDFFPEKVAFLEPTEENGDFLAGVLATSA
jgi:Zn-dependent M28 family amino/carboxypeptidase